MCTPLQLYPNKLISNPCQFTRHAFSKTQAFYWIQCRTSIWFRILFRRGWRKIFSSSNRCYQIESTQFCIPDNIKWERHCKRWMRQNKIMGQFCRGRKRLVSRSHLGVSWCPRRLRGSSRYQTTKIHWIKTPYGLQNQLKQPEIRFILVQKISNRFKIRKN